jgi:hypothetical protein
LAQAILARYLGRSGNWAWLRLIFKADLIDPLPRPSFSAAQAHLTMRLSFNPAFQTYWTVQPVVRMPARSAVQPRFSGQAGPSHQQLTARARAHPHGAEPFMQTFFHRPRARTVVIDTVTQRHLAHHFIGQEQRIHHLIRHRQGIEADRPLPRTGSPLPAATGTRPLPFDLPVRVAAPGLSPVPRIVHRPRLASSAAAERSAATTPQASSNRVNPASTSEQPTMLSPTVNMNQLTDQVIQAIDRRIIGQRERMGRS